MIEPSAERASHELVVVYSRLRRRLLDLSPLDGITPTQRSVTARLSKEGPASTSELAAAERVRPQSMAATVAALEEVGLVERADDPADGRRRVVTLTPYGRDLVEGQRSARREWLADAIATGCTPAEITTLVDAMKILDRVLDV
ncbi:MAG: MarR family transcriptional regulator [Marmoricola sp.]|nr:MarR family transcriptional regulator [Marmoricola sp.]